MVLNGQEDEGFADHIVERMKEIGLKIFYPQIDLIAGWIWISEWATKFQVKLSLLIKIVYLFSYLIPKLSAEPTKIGHKLRK